MSEQQWQLTDQEISTAIAEAPVPAVPAQVDIPSAGLLALPVEKIQAVLGEFKARRTAVRDWVRSQLIEGVHFGFPPGCYPRHEDRDDGRWYLMPGAREPVHASQWTPKPSLYKAGADFLVEMMMLRPEFAPDRNAWEQLGSKPGIVAIKCRLITEGSPFFPGRSPGDCVGEGIGAAEMGKKGRDANAALKVAQKCAKVDAIINALGLSDLFTQDVEDQTAPRPTPTQAGDAPQTPPRAERRPVKIADAIRSLSADFQKLYPEEAGNRSAFVQWVRSTCGVPDSVDLGKVANWTLEMVEACERAIGEEGGRQ